MNKTQRLVLIIGAIAVLTVTLFPPWVYQVENETPYGRVPGRHKFVFSPSPTSEDLKAAEALRDVSAWLDAPRLAGELAGLVLATAGLVLALWRRPE